MAMSKGTSITTTLTLVGGIVGGAAGGGAPGALAGAAIGGAIGSAIGGDIDIERAEEKRRAELEDARVKAVLKQVNLQHQKTQKASIIAGAGNRDRPQGVQGSVVGQAFQATPQANAVSGQPKGTSGTF